MTREHLEKILMHGYGRLYNEGFDRIFEPEYHTFEFSEWQMKQETDFMQFDHKALGLGFKSGKVGCSGVSIEFTSQLYDYINVSVGYGYFEKRLYNNLLIVPYYTKTDYLKKSKTGILEKKSISQTAKRVTNLAQAKAYIKQLHKRFECPSRDAIHRV